MTEFRHRFTAVRTWHAKPKDADGKQNGQHCEWRRSEMSVVAEPDFAYMICFGLCRSHCE